MLGAVVRKAANDYGDHVAYVSADGWPFTYEQLDRHSDEAAAGLAERGVAEGTVVVLALPSTIDYLVAYAALAKLGAITAGINPRYQPAERLSAIETVAAEVIIATADLAGGLEESSASLVLIEPAGDAAEVLRELRADGATVDPLPDNIDRPVTICFTSGSTGHPKGALFTNRQLEAIRDLDTGGAWGGGGHAVAPTEFAHVGFMTKWPWLLASGSTTHLQHKWKAARVLELLHEYRMPVIAGVAPQVALLLRQPNFDDYDFSAVTTIVAGAAASPPALVAEARKRFGANYVIRYSSTESGGIGLGTAPDADDEEVLHTVGRPRSGVDVEVRGEDLAALPDGEIGELWLRSPAMMDSYWRNPEATADTIVDGWLRTGDLALVDDAGLVRLAGRVKEMFIRGGYNVYPLEVESVLSTHPGVLESVVIPRPDDVMGEVGVAAVVAADPDNPPTLEELRAHAGESLAAYKLPEALVFVEEFPRNANAKVDRRELANQVNNLPTV